jgi:hypothetical protein
VASGTVTADSPHDILLHNDAQEFFLAQPQGMSSSARQVEFNGRILDDISVKLEATLFYYSLRFGG